MTSPAKRKGRAANGNPDLSHHNREPQSNGGPDSSADRNFDQQIVDAVNRDLWAAVFDGFFRLARPCSVCGRWLTSGKSKRAGVGPRCAQRVAE